MSTQTNVPQEPQSLSIYVGDLNPDVNERVLFDAFKDVGNVQFIRVCRDEMTKQSLGYAYVNFTEATDAEKAIGVMNNVEIMGRPCRVSRVQRDPTDRRTGKGNLFIGDLDPEITGKELYDTFAQIGKIVSCKLVTDRSQRSLGFGYVHFENDKDADAAIKLLNGKTLKSKVVRVCKFIPKKKREEFKAKSWTNVYIKQFPTSWKDTDLEAQFTPFGKVTSCIVMRDKEGNSKGFGFCNFENHDDAEKAVDALHGKTVDGSTLYCTRAQKKTERTAYLLRQHEQKRNERIAKYEGLNLYIKNIEDHITEDKLRENFEKFGKITSVKIMTHDDGSSKGFGFVCFSTQEEAQKAMEEMEKKVLPGCTKPLYVRMHERKEVRAQRFRNRRNKAPMAMNQMYGQQMMYPAYAYPPQMPVGRRFVPYQSNYAGNKPRLPPNQQPPQGHVQEINSIDQLMQLDENQRSRVIGDRLYSKIKTVLQGEDPKVVGKITGMFLKSGATVKDLFHMIHDDQTLKSNVEQALGVIRSQSQQSPANK